MVTVGNLKLEILPFGEGIFEVVLYDLNTGEIISTLITEIFLQDCEKNLVLDTDGKKISIVPREGIGNDRWVM